MYVYQIVLYSPGDFFTNTVCQLDIFIFKAVKLLQNCLRVAHPYSVYGVGLNADKLAQ